jgi:hypothetical protein
MYRIAALGGKLSVNTPDVASGSFWMQDGVDVELRGDFQAAAFMVEMDHTLMSPRMMRPVPASRCISTAMPDSASPSRLVRNWG